MPYPRETPPNAHLRQPPPAASATEQHRHHRTRFLAHRVRESLQTRMAKLVCSIFLSLLFVASLIVFILWLSLRPHRPRFHVASFSFPGLANNASSGITFDLSDRNPNRNIGIYYDTTMEGSLFYQDQKIAVTPLLPPFYQPPKNTTMLHGVFGLAPAVMDDMRNKLVIDLRKGKVWFRLELKVTIRFRVRTWDTHRHRMHVNCDVAVGPDGVVLPEVKQTRCSIYFS